MAQLPPDITVQSFNMRFDRAFAVQRTWQSILSDAYEFFIPQQNVWRFQNLSPGQRRDSRIMDGLPEDAMNEGANKVKASITPDWREWALLKGGFELPEDVRENKDLQEQLQEITKTLFSHINQSNFSIQIGEAYKDWLIGTGAVEVRENTDLEGSVLVFTTQNQQLIAYEEGPFGNIENEYKNRRVAARNAEGTYPGGDFSQTIREAMKSAPTKEFDFREGFIKTKIGYFLIVLEASTDQAVWSEFQGMTNPIAVFRYAVMADEIRGRGPALSALPDSRTLNKIQEFALQKMALELSGMYTATDDGVFNANTITIAPGIVIPVQSNATTNPTLARLDTGADLQLSFFELDRMSQAIRKALFNDLRDPTGPVRSATEIVIESRELAAKIGSAFGRIQTEGLIPLLNRSLEILQRRGIIPKLIIDGRQITVQFTSPLAKAQDTEDLLAVQSSIELSKIMAGEEITAIGFNLELIPEFIAKKTGMDVELVRDEGQREQVKQDLLEAAQTISASQEIPDEQQQQLAQQ